MYVLGIDLGTTYSAAAVWRDGRAEIVSLGSRSAAIPSVVFLREDETVLTGEAADRRALTEPDRVAREFKRRLGDTTPIMLGGAPYSAEALIGRLLRTVVDQVDQREGGARTAICVTHPANWGPYKMDLLHQAVRDGRASTEPVTFVTEPEAAAIHYASNGAGRGRCRSSRCTTSAVARSTPRCCARPRTGSRCSASPRASSGWAASTSTRRCSSHVAGRSAASSTSSTRTTRRGRGGRPAAARSASRPRRRCRRTPTRRSRCCCPTSRTEVRLTRAEFEAMVRPALDDSDRGVCAGRCARPTSARSSCTRCCWWAARRASRWSPQMVGAELGRPVAVDAHPKHAVALGAAWLASGATANNAPASTTTASAATGNDADATGATAGTAAAPRTRATAAVRPVTPRPTPPVAAGAVPPGGAAVAPRQAAAAPVTASAVPGQTAAASVAGPARTGNRPPPPRPASRPGSGSARLPQVTGARRGGGSGHSGGRWRPRLGGDAARRRR